jgi:3-methyladenine DNA glycosylase AlkD
MLVERYPQLILVMIDWSRNDNIWIRRVAILFQLMYREKTNTAVLEQILANNRGSGEFFIDKAMGWILRQYSKTNPLWVRNYIDNNRSELSKLTLREAAKYI